MSTLASRIMPTKRFRGLAVLDDVFLVGGEVRVWRRFVAQFLGVGFGQRDGFRRPPNMP